MFGLFKKKSRRKDHLFLVTYSICPSIDTATNKVTFNLDDIEKTYVYGDHLLDAQREFASKNMLTPHVYVHSISQVDRRIGRVLF